MAVETEGRAPPRLGGRFTVVDRLGDGGTAGVYLAWDQEQRRWCALKALHHRYLKDEEMRRRFSQEAQALAKLRHDHIATLLAHDESACPPYLVMELARCGSVMDWLKDHGAMPPRMASDVMIQVCQALAEAHATGIVHRDVKPHNFLLDDKGCCKLTDFGIARLTETTSFTATGSQIGTFSFMAPEQRSDTKSVDLRADVYSVGASLYTLLTARTSAELFVADQDDELLVDVATPLRDVIVRATRYKADERYPSVLELQAELEAARAALPPDPPGSPPLARPPEPLPLGPPKVLPAGRRFEDLEKSLALDPAHPVSSSTPRPDPEPRRKVVPYFMPARSEEAPVRTVATSGVPIAEFRTPPHLPSYLHPEAAASIRRAEEAAVQQRERSAQQAQAAATRRAPEPEADPGPGWERFALPLAAAMFLAVLLVGGVTAYGASAVGAAHRRTDDRRTRLVDTLVAESNVVYDLGGDRRVFEELYLRAVDRRSEDHVVSALAFVDQVEALSATRGPDAPPSESVQRLRDARSQYVDALRGWEAASTSVPGRFAVSAGLAQPPR